MTHPTLYTWRGQNYSTTLYAHPNRPVGISWVVDKDTPRESSGMTQVNAWRVQEEIYRLEGDGYEVEAIALLT